MDGYITIPTEIFRQLYFSKTKELQVLLWLYANDKGNGEVTTSVMKIANELHLTYRNIRTAFEKLTELGLIQKPVSDKQVTNVTLEYQTVTTISDKRVTNDKKSVTNERQTSDKRHTSLLGSYEDLRQTSDKRVTNDKKSVTNERQTSDKRHTSLLGSYEDLRQTSDKRVTNEATEDSDPHACKIRVENNINNNNDNNIYFEKEEGVGEEKTVTTQTLTLTPELPSDIEKDKIDKNGERVRENCDKRQKEFYKSLIPYLDRYGKEMIREFYDYWSEKNKSKTKMRFETEKTWDTSRRLAYWANRQRINTSRPTNYETRQQQEQQRRDEVADLVNRLIEEG